MNIFKSTREVAAQLGVRESLIHDALRRGRVLGVSRVGHALVWDLAAVERLREALSKRMRAGAAARDRAAAEVRRVELDRGAVGSPANSGTGADNNGAGAAL